MNKKPIYKRPWFIPLLITILIILVAITYIQIKANTYYYPSTLGAGWSTYQKVGYAWPTFIAELFGIPLIALIWIIFGLYMLWRKIYTKDAPPEKNNKD